MKRINLVRLRLMGLVLAVLITVLTCDLTAFAQTNPTPRPTPRPSGSNPAPLEKTDIPVEWSLFWVFVFFAALAVGLIFANWLVRRGTFNEPEKQL